MHFFVAVCLALAVCLSGCSSMPLLSIPPPTMSSIPQRPMEAIQTSSELIAKRAAEEDITDRPVVDKIDPIARSTEVITVNDPSKRFPANDSIEIALDSMPMRQFIAYVLGDQLKASFIIAENTPSLDETVTFATQGPVSSRRLFRLTTEVLSSKKLMINEREGVFFIGPSEGRSIDDLPIGYGSKPADVPNVSGKILQVIPIRYGTAEAIRATAGSFLDIQIREDPRQSAIFVTGTRSIILKLLEVIRLVDQPSARASRVGVINLTYVGSKEFINQLVEVLENEGIPTGTSRAEFKSVNLVPLEQLGSVVVFAINAEILDRVEFWVRQLDRPSQGAALRYFVYQPKFARAVDLAKSIAPIIGVSTDSENQPVNASRDTRSAIAGSVGDSSVSAMRRGEPSTLSSQSAFSARGEGISLSVDQLSNSLVIHTTGLKYESLLPIVRRLDVPPKQIMLEATIAEVSLTGEFANGVEFAFQKNLGKPMGFLESGEILYKEKVIGSSTLGLPSGGLGVNWVISASDQIRIRLNSSDGQVRVLSKPILVVRDGVMASISVGNDVPTVGATASSPLQSDRTLTTVLYRKTGLELNVLPTINAEGSVLMQIEQKISSTVPGSSGVSGAPIFFERSVSTEVLAQSGQSVLLAGLISDSGSDSSSRIPFLSRLPGLGAAFRSDSKRREKTELVLLITPKVIEGYDEWPDVLNAISDSLNQVQLPRSDARAPQ
jgi:general secretion pathway protein D